MEIFHSLTICRVPRFSIPVYVEALGTSGFLYSQLRETQGFITASLLQSCGDVNLFQIHCFWTSFDAYVRARKKPGRAVFDSFLKNLAVQTIELGPFAPPDLHNASAHFPSEGIRAFLEREYKVAFNDGDAEESADK